MTNHADMPSILRRAITASGKSQYALAKEHGEGRGGGGVNSITAYYVCPHCDNNYFESYMSRMDGKIKCCACGKVSTFDECRKPITLRPVSDPGVRAAGSGDRSC